TSRPLFERYLFLASQPLDAFLTLYFYDLGKVNKEQTSYDDLLDAFRLALKGISLVKKEKQIE
ncbi:MAG TPA: hypothetical protein VL854_05470, partial [Nitrososphaeraceae archaeon]|nr:hypothetical protein [Nitrososphaeraceae archaeon]